MKVIRSIKTWMLAIITVVIFLAASSSEANAWPREALIIRVPAPVIVAPVRVQPGFVWIGGHYRFDRYGVRVWVPGHWRRV